MLALIPARGGSKGLPGKNIKLLGGKPLIAHTIEAALAASSLDEVVVTTDDEEIARIAREYGANVPFIRPASLAQDTSVAWEAYLYTIERLERERNQSIAKFMVLLPTTPLRKAEDIDKAYQLFLETKATTLVSMKEAEVPAEWYFVRDASGKVKQREKGAFKNRQEYPKYYVPNGAIYILDHELLKTRHTYYCENTVAYIMPSERSVDIDTYFDFALSCFLLDYQDYCV